MKLFIASDHAGYELKQKLIQGAAQTLQLPIEWTDLGTHSLESVDYPDYGKIFAEAVKKSGAHQGDENLKPLGVLICGSGIGISISANRFPFLRAALCESETTAALSREHNQANVLCLGARILTYEQAFRILKAYLTAQVNPNDPSFGRHLRRIKKLSQLPTL